MNGSRDNYLENRRLLETYDRIVAAAKRHGIVAAMHNNTPTYARKMVERGFNMVTFGSDVGFMLMANQGAMGQFTGSAAAASTGY